MNIKFFTGSTDFPDYRSITSATNTQKTSAGREAGDYDKISLNKTLRMICPLPVYLPGRPQPDWRPA